MKRFEALTTGASTTAQIEMSTKKMGWAFKKYRVQVDEQHPSIYDKGHLCVAYDTMEELEQGEKGR